MQAIPYVGMPAMRRYFPSLAPVDMEGTTGRPGHIVPSVRAKVAFNSGRRGEGGTATMGMSFLSDVFSATKVIMSLESATTLSNVLRTSSGSSPGNTRQLTLARAVCGRALGAWPPESMVATQVVWSSEL